MRRTMAAKQQWAAVAVTLLLCLSGALAAEQVDAKSAAAASKDAAKAATNAAQPQHAPQFPQDPSLVSKRDSKPEPAKPAPAAPTPAAAAPKEQQQQKQPASAPAPAQKAPEAPKAPAAADKSGAAAKAAEPKHEPNKKEEPKKEPENPCAKAIPGCLECKPFDKSASSMSNTGFGLRRRLHQRPEGMDALAFGTPNSGKKNGMPNVNFLDLVMSPYDAKDLPMCTKCNATAGYVSHSRGRCACAAGYGDTQPTGTCNRCPNGWFSTGGFRAVCKECDGVAASNGDRSACVCVSGWYGVTSYATKQASCNQCPGARPVSPDGARSSNDCFACPEGKVPNEIFSQCVDPSQLKAPEDGFGNWTSPNSDDEQFKGPDVKPLFNASTFNHTNEEWKLTTRNTQNHSNIFTDIFGGVMDNFMAGKNITPNAKGPLELLYQVVAKPTAPTVPKLPTLPNIDMQNPQALGAGVGAALSAVPAALSKATAEGAKITDVVESVSKAVEASSKSVGMEGAAATANGGGWESFLKGLAATAPKDASGKSDVADFASSVGELFGAVGKAASQVAETSDNSLVKGISGLMAVAKKGDVQVPLTPEAALIAAPDGQQATDTSKDFGSMLTNMLRGQAPAPAAGDAAAPKADSNGWGDVLSGFVKSAVAKPDATPAPAPAQAADGDITKMLAGLTAPKKPLVKNDGSTGTITATGVTSTPEGAAGALDDAVTAITAGSGASDSAGSGSSNGIGSLLSGLMQKRGSFSFATPGGNKLEIPKPGELTSTGFISVPSAPPKGSSAIKSGRFAGLKSIFGKPSSS